MSVNQAKANAAVKALLWWTNEHNALLTVDKLCQRKCTIFMIITCSEWTPLTLLVANCCVLASLTFIPCVAPSLHFQHHLASMITKSENVDLIILKIIFTINIILIQIWRNFIITDLTNIFHWKPNQNSTDFWKIMTYLFTKSEYCWSMG